MLEDTVLNVNRIIARLVCILLMFSLGPETQAPWLRNNQETSPVLVRL